MLRRFWVLAFLGILLCLGQVAFAQSTGSNTNPNTGSNNPGNIPSLGEPGASIGIQPEPYKPDEFPIWAYDIRRGEIITVGAFPIAYLVSSICYDLGNWIFKYASGDPNYSNYTPFSTSKPAYTNGEITGLLISALCVSVVVAIIDFALGQAEAAQKAKAAQEKRDAEAASASRIEEEAPAEDSIPADAVPAEAPPPGQSP